jgi:hypothetical protein
MKASMAQHDVLSKYPNADVVALRQQELSYVCQLLNNDKSIKTTEKIAIIQSVAEGSLITKQMIQKAQAPKPQTTTSVVGNGNTVINGDHNQIQISTPPTNLYAAQTTYRLDGQKMSETTQRASIFTMGHFI